MSYSDLILSKVYNLESVSMSSEVGMNPMNGEYKIQVQFNNFQKMDNSFTLKFISLEINEFIQMLNIILLLKNKAKLSEELNNSEKKSEAVNMRLEDI